MTLLLNLGFSFMEALGRNVLYSVVFPAQLFFWINVTNIPTIAALLNPSTSSTSILTAKNTYFNSNLLAEQSMYSLREHKIWRSIWAQNPRWLPLSGNVVSTSTDTRSNILPVSTTSGITISNRARGYDELPAGLNLFTISNLIANDKEARSAYLRCLTPQSKVPRILNEMIKSHRDGQIGQFNFSNCVDSRWIDFSTALNLTNTYWDINLLRTDAGMSSLIDDFMGMANTTGCYIVFEDAVGYPMSAGRVVSASAINTDSDYVGTSLRISAFQGNQIPNSAKTVYFVDAQLGGRYLSTIAFGPTAIPLQGEILASNVFDTQNYCLFMVGRVCGQINNRPPEMENLSTRGNSTPVDGASPQPQPENPLAVSSNSSDSKSVKNKKKDSSKNTSKGDKTEKFSSDVVDALIQKVQQLAEHVKNQDQVIAVFLKLARNYRFKKHFSKHKKRFAYELLAGT